MATSVKIVKPDTAKTVSKTATAAKAPAKRTAKKPAKTDAQRVSKIERSMYYKGAEWDDLWTAVEEYFDPETGEVRKEGGDDILKAVEKMSGDIEAKAVTAGSLYLELESKLEEMKEMKRKLEKAMRDTEARAEALKGSVALFMQSVGLEYASDGFVKIGYRTSQSVDVYNEAMLDSRYIRVRYEPDKIAIRDALKNGEDVPGAEMKSNTTLTIRT